MSEKFVAQFRFGCKPNLPGLGLRRLFFLKLTVMVRLQTAPTGPGEDIELPIYFLKLRTVCGTKDTQTGKFVVQKTLSFRNGVSLNSTSSLC